MTEQYPEPEPTLAPVETTMTSSLTNENNSSKQTKRKTWVISYVSQVFQTLEDICVNIALSQDSDEQVKILYKHA